MSQSVTGVSSSWPAISGPAGVARQPADDGGEVAARAPPGDGELARDAAELDGVLGDPLDGGERIVDGGREAVLRRVAVVDRHDDGA